MGLDSTSPDLPSPQVTTLTMPNAIFSLQLFGYFVLIGTSGGEICLFNLSSQKRWDFRVDGAILDLGIYDLYLVVHTPSKIYIFALPTTEDERDLPNLIVHVPSFDVVYNPLLPASAAPHPLTGNPVINIVYYGHDTLEHLIFGSIILEIGQEGLRVEKRTLAADDSGDSDDRTICLTRVGHRHALSLTSFWGSERKIVLSEVQAIHGRQVIRKELKLPHADWPWGVGDPDIHWDEVSGRVCISGLGGSEIMVLEL
ncbi:hypothetical protein BS47DRAFT_869867 [Hydnum rufescens UP504]|uniref:Uncharacterized protein n=1 Tax=Hydnum rufescens UP504 TaxID=1448309 RepID=A0A9P6AYM3_9AGAM|nr:hypothetical protein BS47DRAFT_869867 [Hydnum rufescens UP504]